jgi:two-component system OmpR family sensor kinase
VRTPSLERQALRAALVVLGVVALAAAIAASVFLDTRAQIEADLDRVLETRAGVAEQLLADADGDLAEVAVRLAELGVPARITAAEGRDVSVTELASVGAVGALGDGDTLGDGDVAVRAILVAGGGSIEVLASRGDADMVLGRLLLLLVGGLLLVVLLVVVLVRRGVASALRPLTQMRATARRIAGGAREERLRADDATTELGALAADLDAMLDALEGGLAAARTAEQSQRRFLADVAHQLRTPMAGIRVSTELLLLHADGTPEERERLLGNLVRETTRVTRMVNGLLRISRLDLEKGLRLKSTDLVALCATEVERQQELAEVPIELTVIEAPATPVLIDPEQFTEALANLLDNARRFARGRIEVTVAELEDGQVVVRVIDDGPGLAPEDRERAFERFVTFGPGVGTGLGLPIARGIARAHGGELDLVDGAFEIRLPGAVGVTA